MDRIAPEVIRRAGRPSADAAAPRVAVATLGCKVNQCESAGLQEGLRAAGYVPVPFGEPAVCTVVNTCAVTASAGAQSRQLVRQAVRANPGALVVVTGCYAQVSPGEIARIPGVALVAGNAEKELIPRLLAGAKAGAGATAVSDVGSVHTFVSSPAALAGRTRAFFKIQDGCNAYCSYCIVPYARGRSRSLPFSQVREGLTALARSGYREAVLTGIHLGAYGEDLAPPATLADVVRWAGAERPVERLRLSSVEPNEITDELIALAAASRVVCSHFHIPLQSGDDAVLRGMGRTYDAAFAAQRCASILRAMPDAAIGVDVMVGYPGEDEEAFARTCAFLEDLPAAYFHVFPYSRRPGTAAAELPGQIGEREKKRRASLLRSLGTRKREVFAARFLGRTLSVLVEREGSAGGFWRGFSGNYLPVRIRADRENWGGRIVTVLVEHAENGTLTGRRIADDT
jgi:threonylcarbamoyladenosine tRNA methylthiotransferase MtaB